MKGAFSGGFDLAIMVRKTLDGYPKNDGYTLKKVRVWLKNRVIVGSVYVGKFWGCIYVCICVWRGCRFPDK